MDQAQRLIEGYQAWNRRDFETAISYISPDVVWTFHGGGQFPGTDDVYHGHEGVRRFWREFLEPWESFSIEIDETREVGDQVLLFVTFRGTGAGSGVELEVPFVHVWTLRDRLGVRFQAFADRDEALRSAGITE